MRKLMLAIRILWQEIKELPRPLKIAVYLNLGSAILNLAILVFNIIQIVGRFIDGV